MTARALFLFALGLVTAAGPLRAEVKLARPLGEHMVLQREMPVPLWGTAAPGEAVIVEFRDQKKAATASAAGKWRVVLDPLKPGGPDALTVGGKKLEDVLVGDVWLGSGQSNMAMSATQYVKNDPALAANVEAGHPLLRLLGPQGWSEATPAVSSTFSALLFSFGVPLQKELKIPVGLIVAAVGGTPSGFWLSEKMYRDDPGCTEAVKAFEATHTLAERTAAHDEEMRKYEAAVAAWRPLAEQAKQEGKPVPPAPRNPGPLVPPGESSGKIGGLFEQFVRPLVGLACRGVLWDQGESRTGIVGVDQYSLMGALIRGWRQEWGQGEFPFLYMEKPSGGGTAWDLHDPVTDKGDAFTPLPAGLPPPPPEDYSHELHLRMASFPRTFVVPTTDLGRGTHPTNKSGYGARAARVALGAVYGRAGEIMGPLYASHEVKDGKVIVKFTHVGKGLAVRPGATLQGFAVAGEDKKFVWADAQIAGSTVVLSSKTVAAPVAVRYAWSINFPWANLFNQDELPAQPFRTDK